MVGKLVQALLWCVMLARWTTLTGDMPIASRFSMGLKAALCCSITTGIVAVEDWLTRGMAGKRENPFLVWMEYGFGAVIILIALSYPRNPATFHMGRPVDGENNSSILGLLTFKWSSPLITLAGRRRELNLSDLPLLKGDMRTHSLQDEFLITQGRLAAGKNSCSLFEHTLFSLYSGRLFCQLALSVPLACLAFTPQFALYRMLRLLEAHSLGDADRVSLTQWSLVLGLAIGASLWLENWLIWIALNKVSVPMTGQLSALLYRKAVRCDSRRPDAKPNGAQSEGNNVMNLIAIDVPRIATVACFLYSNFLQAMKLAVACTLLAQLLGWQSLLTGLSCLGLFYPLQTRCLSRCSAAEQQLASVRDRKMAALTEVINGIRQVKFAGLESKWEERLNGIRDCELRAQHMAFLWHVMNLTVHLLGPVVVSAVSLTAHNWIYGPLAPSVAFPALSTIGYLQFILGLIPELLSGVMAARISIRRVKGFLGTPELLGVPTPSHCIEFEHATLSYHKHHSSEGGVLRDVSVIFPPQELTVVSGRTGSGKSLLLTAIVGESVILSGVLRRPLPPPYEDIHSPATIGMNWILDNAVAYVAQTPWIEAGTIRDNICFGLPLNPVRYSKVMAACALTKDLELFEHNDLTYLGPNGVNLSGGQKVRVGLARALYSRAGILILDDIFNAVDVHTAHHLLAHALAGELSRGRTRVLATHHVDLCLPKASFHVQIADGIVRSMRKTIDSQHQSPRISMNPSDTNYRSTCSNLPIQEHDRHDGTTREAPSTKHEARGHGSTAWLLFRQYMKASGGWLPWATLIGCYVVYQGLLMVQYRWVGSWSAESSITSSEHGGVACFMSMYAGIAGVACLAGSLRAYVTLYTSLNAATQLFRLMLSAILRAPLQWLDKIPPGWILNRLTADFYMLDSRIGFDIIAVLNAAMDCVGVIMGGVLVRPILIVFAVALAVGSFWYTSRYLAAARDVKRLESITRSPVYEQIASSLQGIVTIRAFGQEERYIKRVQAKLDHQAQASWHLYLFNRWFTLRINVLGATFSTVTALATIARKDITGLMVGFALAFTNHLSFALVTLSRAYSTLEMDMDGVERILEYCKIEKESSAGSEVPAEWPERGGLSVVNLTVSYDPDTASVLRNVSFSVEPGQRIGIVGRTGAGKSTLALALFRFLEARDGSISIDGVNISTIKLKHLRRRLAMIPQNPVLFTGTIRSNLDPFDAYDDDTILRALKNVQWPAKGLDSQGILASVITEGGSNLSHGQRQLLCLVRAILSRPAILVLDEATSAVDRATDALIQQSIRTGFGRERPTLLVIAHRIQTIADFDKVLVMDAGQVVEFGSPRDLLRRQDGAFRRLVGNDAERDGLQRVINAAG
ncbi:ABC bile acid transporter [Aspergillus heteromorphus CBS 117.55]|uniref:ABC bile acid transporter n=1 Tax=Aspergillus heteromorphus CBS 117.55 TaxID=1448321 RepID=A0A317V5T3_9EURO|nr:ABC bile acid transporter [Aspergillus heteromorphus CBS 117.55]PWY68398.1 ABC bile acid transporter [Aspergillus heteromorphus CBS 117.55]